MTKKENLVLLAVAILTAVICHFLFSPYGFNPTDEGFVLSSSVRLLHGQIPHVDFSSLRPMGYGYLHIPELLINHDHTFLISRFVFWLEISLIAYVWVLILQFQLSTINFQLSTTLYIITFIFNAHYFPIAVLHTIDGLLLAVIGFYILFRFEKWQWLAGLLIGYSVLCKQGFVVLIPLILLLFKNKKTAFIFSLIPGILYVAFISFNGGWNDMITQLTAHSEILDVGILNYLLNPFLYAGIIFCLIFQKTRLKPVINLLLIPLTLLLLLITNHYHGKALLFLFGYAFVEVFYQNKNRKIYFLALALAWCVSISIGYASIALFGGGMMSLLMSKFILGLAKDEQEQNSGGSFAQPFIKLRVIPLLTGLIIAAFIYARFTNIYREADRAQLTYNLQEIVPGANGIYTDRQTNEVLNDIYKLRQEYSRLVILPDFTALQLFNSKRPVLTEWPNRAEIPNEKILEKVVSKLKTDPHAIIAISKYQTALLKDSLAKADYKDYSIIQFIRKDYHQFDETEYFELYRK